MFLEPSSKFHPFDGIVEVLGGKMALSAELRNDVSQAYGQYSARKSSAETPIVCNAMGAVIIDVFEIGISLVPDVSEDLTMLKISVLHLRPRHSIYNRNLHTIRLFNMISFGI